MDGTKGDVELHRVDVDLGSSRFIAKGVVEGTKGVKGKRVVVNVKSENANLGELLRLVSKAAQPPAYGARDRYGVRPPAGEGAGAHARAARRLGARGTRHLYERCRAGQDRRVEPARTGQADGHLDRRGGVKLSSKFALKNGVFTYQALSFNVQGADVQLNGTHSLRSKTLNLAGEVKLKATVSQTMSGFKSGS